MDDIILFPTGVYVLRDEFNRLFHGCKTYDDYKNRDAGFMGYADYIDQLQAGGFFD